MTCAHLELGTHSGNNLAYPPPLRRQHSDFSDEMTCAHLELGDVDVQRTLEAERGGERRDDLHTHMNMSNYILCADTL